MYLLNTFECTCCSMLCWWLKNSKNRSGFLYMISTFLSNGDGETTKKNWIGELSCFNTGLVKPSREISILLVILIGRTKLNVALLSRKCTPIFTFNMDFLKHTSDKVLLLFFSSCGLLLLYILMIWFRIVRYCFSEPGYLKFCYCEKILQFMLRLKIG